MIPASVMLAEDNLDDEFLARRILRKVGITAITVVCDGQKALDLLLNPDLPLPEMLILDLRLQKVDGVKVFTELRRQERTLTLPVVILSSSNDPRDRATCIKLGATAFLTKPLELSDLLQLFSRGNSS